MLRRRVCVLDLSICVISATTSDLNCEPLSDKNKVGRYACLVMTSTMQRPIVFAVTFFVGYANRYRENTSIIVTMFWYPDEFGRFGSMSISSMSSGPNTCSVLLIIFGQISLFWILLYLMQSSHCITHCLILFANPG